MQKPFCAHCVRLSAVLERLGSQRGPSSSGSAVLVLGCSFLGTKASFTYTDLFRCLASVRFTRSSTWYTVDCPDPQPLRLHVY